MQQFLSDLGEKLRLLEKIESRLHTEREELVSNLEELSSTLFQWGINEPQLVDTIRCAGTCVENCASYEKTLVMQCVLSLTSFAKHCS